jgi:hypothetical protein
MSAVVWVTVLKTGSLHALRPEVVPERLGHGAGVARRLTP